MKKIFSILSVCAILASCAGGSDSSVEEASSGENLSANAQQSSADTNVTKIGTGTGAETAGSSGTAKGESLISSSDCTTCHTPDTRIVGPSYKEIAAKYPMSDANVEMLAGKVIQGGSGNWGEIPMTPHPDLSKEDAKEMVTYILSLK